MRIYKPGHYYRMFCVNYGVSTFVGLFPDFRNLSVFNDNGSVFEVSLFRVHSQNISIFYNYISHLIRSVR